MGSLAVETAALKLLGRSGPFSVNVPHVIEFSTNPVFLVTTYLPGRIVEAATLPEISLKDREALGHDIGAYILAEAQQVDVEAAQREVPSPGEEDTWQRLFEVNVGSFSSPVFPSTSKLAKLLYARWLEYQKYNANEQFIHGDLRLGNMAVAENNRLYGVFDFGRAGTGTASNEISPLANLDSTILRGVINELRTASVDIDMEQVYVWDNMKKLMQLVHYINSGNYLDNPPMFVSRACRILSTHYTEFGWNEFNKLRV
jgi:aminoglycoside phosphotransferase (APT) family kinase protein